MKKMLSLLLCAAFAMSALASDGPLPGKFSIGEGRQVQFSQGNLQYQPYNSIFRFAEHQYDYVGGQATVGNVFYAFDRCSNTFISPDYDGWIDLFGWGTAEVPFLSSENSGDYWDFVDWGSRTIMNGGFFGQAWRTLNFDEWSYLLVGRPNADQLRGQATVDKVHGYILLPDDWQLPKKLAFTPEPNNWTTNVYSAAQWKQMEKNGAVFLPAAGFRSGREMQVVGLFGFYWSSDLFFNKEGERTDDARDIFFSEKRIGPRDHEKRFYGLSVRLVQDAL